MTLRDYCEWVAAIGLAVFLTLGVASMAFFGCFAATVIYKDLRKSKQ